MSQNTSNNQNLSSSKIKNIIFDFGGVVMDWNQRYFYKDYFRDDEKMEFFLKNIATDEWNAEQDRGRSLAEGTEILVEKHPTWETEIRAFYDNWTTMLRGEIPENVAILRKLAETDFELFGLTNWSHETFPYALAHYDFFEIILKVITLVPIHHYATEIENNIFNFT